MRVDWRGVLSVVFAAMLTQSDNAASQTASCDSACPVPCMFGVCPTIDAERNASRDGAGAGRETELDDAQRLALLSDAARDSTRRAADQFCGILNDAVKKNDDPSKSFVILAQVIISGARDVEKLDTEAKLRSLVTYLSTLSRDGCGYPTLESMARETWLAERDDISRAVVERVKKPLLTQCNIELLDFRTVTSSEEVRDLAIDVNNCSPLFEIVASASERKRE